MAVLISVILYVLNVNNKINFNAHKI